MKFLCKLNYRYFKYNRKSYISICFGVILSTLLMMSFFIVKDSYHDFNVRTTQYMTGSWEISFTLNKKNSNRISDLKNPVVVQDCPLSYKNIDFIFVKTVTKFDDTLGFHLLQGKYPHSKTEISIDDTFAKKENIHLGDRVSFQTEEGTDISYTVSGIFERSITQQNTVFYLYDDSPEVFEQGIIYGELKDSESLNDYKEHIEGVRVNELLLNAKYGTNHILKALKIVAMIAIGICSIIFLFNSFRIQIENKKKYFQQLQLLGATKKQICCMIAIELILVGTIVFILSSFISYYLWYLLINGSGALITRLFNSKVSMDCVLYTKSIAIMLLQMGITFIITCGLTFYQLFHYKNKELHFRNITLRGLPIYYRIGILDMLRKRTGKSIILSIFIGTTLFMCVRYPLNVWLTNKKESFAVFDHTIEATFSFYDLTSQKYTQFANEAEQFCENINKKVCSFEYTLESEVSIKEDLRKGKFVITDDQTYASFVKRNALTNVNGPILLNSFLIKENDREEKMVKQIDKDSLQLTVALLDMSGEVYKTYIERAMVIDDDIYSYREQDDNLLFLCSTSYISKIMREYPGGSVTGSLFVDTSMADVVEKRLSKSFHLVGNDYIYVTNNAKRARSYHDLKKVIDSFVYCFIAVIALLCILNIANILYQYFLSRKQEKALLLTIGMTNVQWKKQIYSQMALYALSGLISAYAIALILNYTVYKQFLQNLTSSYAFPMADIMISSIVCFVILFGLGCYYDRKINKKHD